MGQGLDEERHGAGKPGAAAAGRASLGALLTPRQHLLYLGGCSTWWGSAVLHACVLSAVQAYALVWVGCRLPSAVMDTCGATAASTATGADTPMQPSPTMCHARWLPSDTMRMRLPPLVLTITPSLGTGLIDTAAPLCCCCMLCAGPGVFLEGQRSSRWPC